MEKTDYKTLIKPIYSGEMLLFITSILSGIFSLVMTIKMVTVSLESVASLGFALMNLIPLNTILISRILPIVAFVILAIGCSKASKKTADYKISFYIYLVCILLTVIGLVFSAKYWIGNNTENAAVTAVLLLMSGIGELIAQIYIIKGLCSVSKMESLSVEAFLNSHMVGFIVLFTIGILIRTITGVISAQGLACQIWAVIGSVFSAISYGILITCFNKVQNAPHDQFSFTDRHGVSQ